MKVDDIKQLMEKMSQTGMSLLELEVDGTKLRLERPADHPTLSSVGDSADSSPEVHAAESTSAQTDSHNKEQADQIPGYLVTSPVVGVFYASPSPDHDPFVQVGSLIEAGSTLGIIEAMKLMNEVTSDRSGKILEIMVENGQRVEYGQPLMRIGD